MRKPVLLFINIMLNLNDLFSALFELVLNSFDEVRNRGCWYRLSA